MCREEGCVWMCAERRDVWEHVWGLRRDVYGCVQRGGMCVGECGEEGCV